MRVTRIVPDPDPTDSDAMFDVYLEHERDREDVHRDEDESWREREQMISGLRYGLAALILPLCLVLRGLILLLGCWIQLHLWLGYGLSRMHDDLYDWGRQLLGLGPLPPCDCDYHRAYREEK